MISRRRLKNTSLRSQIELLRRQRKTGRLTFTYAEGYGDLYFKDGELLDASVDQLTGPGAVFLVLTLPDATCKFDPTINPTRRTIFDSWESLVDDAQRQLNEGQLPSELFLQDDEFETAWSRLMEKPFSSMRRAAFVYQATPGSWSKISAVASMFTRRIGRSGAWAVALPCAIIATTVLTTVSIIALNRPVGYQQQPPLPPEGAQIVPEGIRTEQKVPAAGSNINPSVALPTQSYAPTNTVVASPVTGGAGVRPAPDPQIKPASTDQAGGVPTTSPTTAGPELKDQKESPEAIGRSEKEETPATQPAPIKKHDRAAAAQPAVEENSLEETDADDDP